MRSYTISRTCLDSSRISAQVAPPVLMRKPACFSLTCAPPTRFPLSPQASIRVPAKCPGGRLKKAAGARVFEGLLFPPAGKIVLHAGGDKLPFIRCQAETGFRHHAAGLHQHTVTVSELQLFSRGLPRPLSG